MAQEKQLKLHFQRFELKYQIPTNIADLILPTLLNHMDWDPYASGYPNNAYDVHSIYFDSPTFKNHYEKVEGAMYRKKIRVRSYTTDLTEDSPVFVEIKRKYNSIIIKDRVKIAFSDAKELLDGHAPTGHFSENDSDFINECRFDIRYHGMRPKMLVSYKRRPLISKRNGNELRVTFDSDISSTACTSVDFSSTATPIFDGMLVMEVKFNNLLPHWLHDIIQQYQLEAWPYSKYSNGVESAYKYLLPQMG